ncbi:MAG: cache domain-containing protein [Desulfatirhabdiaceae bacterium]
MKKMIGLMLVGLLVGGLLGQAIAAEKGTAAEAEAMIQKALDFYKTNGKEKTLAEVSNPTGQFVKGDLYVFIWDMNGVVIAHGTNSKLIGRDMSQMKDVDGKRFVYDGVELAKAKGKGWVDYKWSNPTTKKVEAKSTYVVKVDDMVFCCGIYK